ncbi:MAG: vitamin K epoxide reductase family protein, partial [Solirubrobacteraceae bacterium]
MSARALRTTLIVLATIGLGWATYLTYVHYSGATPVCSLKGDPCAAVQKSVYSELIGIPVALIGAVGYLLILGSLLASDGEHARFATAALTLGGFAFSLYLTYREVFTLHKICEDCVASAVIMTILVGLSVWRFLRGDAGIAGPRSALAAPSASAEPAAP